MERMRTITLYVVSTAILVIVFLTIILHYPLNLIVDGIVLAVIGGSAIIYIIIWSLTGDQVRVNGSSISIYKQSFPLWRFTEKRLGSREIARYVINGNDIMILTKNGNLIHVNGSVSGPAKGSSALIDLLRSKNIERGNYEDVLKRSMANRESYIERI